MVLLTDCMISVQWNCLGLETRPSHLDCNCVIWRKVPNLSMLLQIIPVNEEDMGPSWPQSLCSFLLYYAPPDSMTGESLGCLTRNQKNYDKFQLHGDTHKCSVYNSNVDFSSENNFLKKIIYTLGLIDARNVLLSALLCCSFVALVVQLPSYVYLWPYGLQHTWLPILHHLLACSNSRPLSWWCHPIISSSVIPFSSCFQSFPVSGSFPMSWLFISGGQSIGASASASVLPENIQDWFPLGLTALISLQSKRLSRVISNSSKASILQHSAFFIVQLSHPYMTTGKIIAVAI